MENLQVSECLNGTTTTTTTTTTATTTTTTKRLRCGLGVSVLDSGIQVRGFKPGRSRRIFKGGKILSTPSFGREVKPWAVTEASSGRTRNVQIGR
jgi:hypothetical protein